MTPDEIALAATLLSEARRSGTPLGELPEACRPASVSDAHAIQDAVTDALGYEVGAFKANAPPDAEANRGVIYGRDIHPSPARIQASTVPLLGVEGEVAFRFTRDLPARQEPYSEQEVAAAVEACAAIEVVHSRYADQAARSFLEKLADCISNGAFVPGETTEDWCGLDMGRIHVELEVNGKTVVAQDGGHPIGDPLGVAVALVNMMRAGPGIRSGQYVTCGSFTGVRFLHPGDTCTARFRGLGEAKVVFPA